MNKLNKHQTQDLSGPCYGILAEIPSEGTRLLKESERVVDGNESGDLEEFLHPFFIHLKKTQITNTFKKGK